LQNKFVMQKFKATILSTRPIDEALVKEAKSKAILIDTISFIETEAIDSIDVYEEIGNALLESVTVVFTSMNAVEAVGAHLHDYTPDWKIYCIGNTTKKLVVEYFGEDLIAGTATGATELAEKIIEDDITNEVIFFCGDKAAVPLGGPKKAFVKCLRVDGESGLRLCRPFPACGCRTKSGASFCG